MGARYYSPATAQFISRDPAYAESGSDGYAGKAHPDYSGRGRKPQKTLNVQTER